MCGEKTYDISEITAQAGSPPHVRGKECVNSARKLPVGITPACAGKRAILFRLLSLPRDHPRMCGEKTKKIP